MEWTTPFGLPVVPLVYRMNSGVLGRQLRRLADVRLSVDHVIPPEVAGLHPLDLVLAAPDHNHLLDRGAGVVLERGVHVGLERDHASATPAPIGGDHHARARVQDAVANGIAAESAENDAVDDPEAGAREHRDRQLRDHREIQEDTVARFEAQ